MSTGLKQNSEFKSALQSCHANICSPLDIYTPTFYLSTNLFCLKLQCYCFLLFFFSVISKNSSRFLYFYWYFSELLRLKCCNIFSLAPIVSPCPICLSLSHLLLLLSLLFTRHSCHPIIITAALDK